MSKNLRVKFSADDSEVTVAVTDTCTMRDVLAQVRQAKGWDEQQFVRFICAGQELYLDDRASRASGVVHCIASKAPSHRYPSHKHSMYKNGEPSSAVDWLEVVDPGTVLMWIFGSILALLWLLFVFYAHMFDKTSVVMLCMMTIAFLIPCALSYVPCLRMLNGPISSSATARQPLYYYSRAPSQAAAPAGSGASAFEQQQQYLRSSGGMAASPAATAGWGGSAYGTQIPPRPAARVRPGAPAPH